MTHDHERFMEIAIEEAREAMIGGDEPFGAVVVREGQVVGRGRNRIHTTKDVTAHSEVMAIREATLLLSTLDLSDCALYTSWEPCAMCGGTIVQAGIGTVYIACADRDPSYGDYTIQGLMDMTKSQIKIDIGILEDISRKLVQEWEANQS